MKVIAADEILAWLDGADASHTASLARFRRPRLKGTHGIRVAIEGSAVDVLGLAYVLLMTEVENDDEELFRGALVWLRDWDIWSSGIERVGHLFLEGLRTAAHDRLPIRERPGHVFASNEFANARATLGLPMMFQWDAVFVPAHGLFVASVSHHGYFDLFVSNSIAEFSLTRRFEAGGHRVQRLGAVTFVP